ncbi:hypothetical protein AB0P12_22455 [Streptomyces subrutilus]|uniref:hypothetical protein n=1 Tax=Streptomyces subrutilus TaxID=36818 RepID=UPI0033F82201
MSTHPSPQPAPDPESGAGPVPDPPPAWTITRGRPDRAETAAVLAVLTAWLGRTRAPAPAPPPPARAAWDRPPARPLPRAGTWRPH